MEYRNYGSGIKKIKNLYESGEIPPQLKKDSFPAKGLFSHGMIFNN